MTTTSSRPWFHKLIWVPLFILSQLPLTIAVICGATPITWASHLIILLTISLAVLGTYSLARRFRLIPAIAWQQFKWSKIFMGFGTLFVTVFAINAIITIFFPNFETTENQAELTKIFTSLPFWWTATPILLAGFFEELIFRVASYELLFPKHPKIAFAFSLTTFTLIHSPTDLPSLLTYASMSLVLTIIYHQFRNYYVNLAVHALWNSLSILMMLATLN